MKLIKVNETNRFFNSSSPEKKEYYEDGDSFEYKNLEGNIVVVPADEIYMDNRLKTLCFNSSNEKYIIYHPYYMSIIRNGYLVYNKYDETFIENKEEGQKIFSFLYDKLLNKVKTETNFKILLEEQKRIEFLYTIDNYEYKIVICTVNEIFKKNQERKINDLPFFSFDKKMDKYGTMYIAIYCKPTSILYSEDEEVKGAMLILNKLIDPDNNIKYVDIEPKSCRVYYIA